VLLVTDGATKPASGEGYEGGYVPFRQRTDPVHVLDVGIGDSEDSDWLIELAEDTEGTYSYVPTASDLAEWIDDVIPYDWQPAVSDSVDTDEDGVSDNVEIRGVVAVSTRWGFAEKVRLTSDPYDTDTDDDSILDGEELGAPASAALLGLGSNSGTLSYHVISDPDADNSDGDGLLDIEEYEFGFDAMRGDADHDQVDDGDEVLWNTSPIDPDSDDDGFADGFEAIDAHQLGFDPSVFDPAISPDQWQGDMAAGYLCGEFCFIDSMGWLMGNLISGLLVFGDARDIFSYAFSGSWLSLGFTAVGLVPLLGDAVRAVTAAVKFIHRTASAVKADLALKMVAGWLEEAPIQKALLTDEFGPNLIPRLEAEGLEDATRLTEVISLTGASHVVTLLDHPNRLPAVRNFPAGGYTGTPWIEGFQGSRAIGAAGEAYVKAMRGIASTVKQVRTDIPGMFGAYRYYDIKLSATSFIEVKTGKVKLTWFVRRQIMRDAQMILADSEVVWVFVGNSKTGIGPDPLVLAALTQNNIPFEIHWPTL
jgi:hypothetical protein